MKLKEKLVMRRIDSKRSETEWKLRSEVSGNEQHHNDGENRIGSKESELLDVSYVIQTNSRLFDI